MELFDAQAVEFDELTAEFEKLVAIEQGLVERTKQIPDILKYCCENYIMFINSTSTVMYEAVNKSVLIFSTNLQKSSIMSQYTRLSEFYSEISSQIITLITEIQNELQPKLKQAIQSSLETLSKYCDKCRTIENQYKEIKSSIYSGVNTLKSISKEAATARKKNETYTATALCEKYLAIFRSMKLMSRNMNQLYIQYNNTIKEAADAFKEEDRIRSKVITEFILKLSDVYQESSENYAKVYQIITDKYSKPQNVFTGEQYIQSFVAAKGIYRTNLSDIVFEAPNFQFEEDTDILIRSSHITVPPIDAPIFLAKAKYNFDGRGENELSIHEGQIIYLYEKPTSQWTLASWSPEYPQGYVPTAAIQQVHKKLAVSLETRATDGDYIGIYPGQFLFVDKEEGDTLLCTNAQGIQGKVRRLDTTHD